MECMIWTRGQETQAWREGTSGGLRTVMEKKRWKGASFGLAFNWKSSFSIGMPDSLSQTVAWPVLAQVGKPGLTEDSCGTGESIPGPIGASNPDE